MRKQSVIDAFCVTSLIRTHLEQSVPACIFCGLKGNCLHNFEICECRRKRNDHYWDSRRRIGRDDRHVDVSLMSETDGFQQILEFSNHELTQSETAFRKEQKTVFHIREESSSAVHV